MTPRLIGEFLFAVATMLLLTLGVRTLMTGAPFTVRPVDFLFPVALAAIFMLGRRAQGRRP